MKRIIFFVLIINFVSGCSYFVPNSIKREQSIVRVDIKMILKEVEQLSHESEILLKVADAYSDHEDYKKASENYRESSRKSFELQKKVLRSYNRVLPHVINIDNYMQRKSSKE